MATHPHPSWALATAACAPLAFFAFAGCGPRCGPGTAPSGGRCTSKCGSGTHFDAAANTCAPDVRCGAGTQANQGQCVPFLLRCADGTHPDGSACAPNVMCGTGTRAVGSSCVPDASACGSGTHLDSTNDACVADVACGPGTETVDGICRPGPGACGPGTSFDLATHACRPDVSCGPGTQSDGFQCVPSGAACFAGTHLSGSYCVPDVTCGAGTRAVGSICLPDTSACGPGTHLDAALRTCAPDVTCGPGTTAVNSQCIAQCPAGTSFDGTSCTSSCGVGTHFDATSRQCLPDVVCSALTTAQSGQCVPTGTNPTCGAGTHLDGAGACVPDEICGAGTHALNGSCVPNIAGCGPGTHLNTSTNSCAADVTCGPSTRAVNGECRLALGGDGPTTWRANVHVSSPAGPDGSRLVAFEPQIAVAQPDAGPGVDAGIDVYIAYPTFYAGGSQVVVAVSHDNGGTFAASELEASSNPAFGNPEHIGDPTIAANGSSAVVAFVAYGASGDGSLYYDVTTDRGATWTGPITLVANSTGLIDRPFWAASHDGNAYLSFTWQNPTPDTTIVRFTAAGMVTQLSHTLWGNSGGGQLSQAPIAVTASGQMAGTVDDIDPTSSVQRAYVVQAPNDDSAPFTPSTWRESDETRSNHLRNLDQWLALSPQDEMLLVWRFNASGSTHIRATATQGGPWPSDPLAGSFVDDAPVSVNCSYPTAASDEQGRWHVLWIDNRYGHWRTYSSSSADGVIWQPSSFASDVFFDESGEYDPTTGRVVSFLGDFISIKARFGSLYAAWTDTRSGVSQVYFATASSP